MIIRSTVNSGYMLVLNKQRNAPEEKNNIESPKNISELYLCSGFKNAKDVKMAIGGSTGSIYLLILPDDREKKTNIHNNHNMKKPVFRSSLMRLTPI